jgi:hypothetical protein
VEKRPLKVWFPKPGYTTLVISTYCKLKRDRKNMKSFGGMMAVAKDVGEIGVGAYGLQDQVF